MGLDILKNGPFVDTEFYEGDLLQSVINADNGFWDNNKELKLKIESLLSAYSDEDKEKFRKGNFREWT